MPDWFALIDELGTDGLERDSVVGEWNVRDVRARQLLGSVADRATALRVPGETPQDRKLHGEISFPPNDDMSEDACEMRADWVRSASQHQLDAMIGSDWGGGTNRIIRLADEVDGLTASAGMRDVGVPVLREAEDMPWGERVAYVADPDGNPIAIAAPAG